MNYRYTISGNTVFNVYLSERNLYGSSRLGQEQLHMELTQAAPFNYSGMLDNVYGDKRYELSNHLGNVLQVITDRKLPENDGTNHVAHYLADVVSYSDYFPYGMQMPGRNGNDGDGYRYGFQNQEIDNEIKGTGNSINYKYRMHDPRIGRFFAINVYGDKRYELSNHLGNVLQVVTDRKIPENDENGNVAHYTADVVSYSDYFPYGMQMPGRNGGTDQMRYGFQAQEKDDEVKGTGNSVNYKYRMHDPRIGRFFAVDPLTKEYPQWSPYQFSGNQVTVTVELEGLEPDVDLNEANYKKGETYQASDDGAKNQQNIFNWKIESKAKGQYSWKQGSQYTGPNNRESASIADHAYNASKETEGDKAPGTEYELMASFKFLGFTMGVYKRDIESVRFNAIAFAGTDDLADIPTDLNQGMAILDYQYELAAIIGNDRKGTKNLTFIGHSLGGGLASLASLKAGGARAVTFNAAGLSYGTKKMYGVQNSPTNKIDAYVIMGEVLNTNLKPLGQGAMGNIHFLKSTGSKNPVSLHTMGEVKKSLGIKTK